MIKKERKCYGIGVCGAFAWRVCEPRAVDYYAETLLAFLVCPGVLDMPMSLPACSYDALQAWCPSLKEINEAWLSTTRETYETPVPSFSAGWDLCSWTHPMFLVVAGAFYTREKYHLSQNKKSNHGGDMCRPIKLWQYTHGVIAPKVISCFGSRITFGTKAWRTHIKAQSCTPTCGAFNWALDKANGLCPTTDNSWYRANRSWCSYKHFGLRP